MAEGVRGGEALCAAGARREVREEWVRGDSGGERREGEDVIDVEQGRRAALDGLDGRRCRDRDAGGIREARGGGRYAFRLYT